MIFDADDAGATLANLVAHESLARVGIALELLVVLTQALTAVWFYRLFRTVDGTAAGSIAAFGLVNAVAILGSAAVLATALGVATGGPGDADTVQTALPGQREPLGGGRALLRPVADSDGNGRAPFAAGCPGPWAGSWSGAASATSMTFVASSPPAPESRAHLVPATVGEFWIIGYLIVFGVRRRALEGTAA